MRSEIWILLGPEYLVITSCNVQFGKRGFYDDQEDPLLPESSKPSPLKKMLEYKP
jgi:hypothetical protein